MPELPEVETVRRTLRPHIVGQRLLCVDICRADVVHADGIEGIGEPGETVLDLVRHGKQLAVITDRRCLCIHLGMSGALCCMNNGQRGDPLPHTHLIWHFDSGVQMHFRDPRRFGGVWLFDSFASLAASRWARLGDDALTIAPKRLHRAFSRTQRAVKAALLDQRTIAGLGNIYVDELLFAARLHPRRPANDLSLATVQRLVRRMRRLLGHAIDAGGSTLRDYVDADGVGGRFQQRHRVYSHAGDPCPRCHRPLAGLVVAGRSTVCCDHCQC
jgi:formamidopyrimidine-DNA glycosylase